MNAYAYGLSNPLTYIDNNGQLANFTLQAVWWELRQAGAAYIRCFGQCLVSSATEASIGVLWQYMMGDCEPGFEFSGMAVLAMQSCGYSCLNPMSWGGKRAKASKKSKAYESRAHGEEVDRPQGESADVTKIADNIPLINGRKPINSKYAGQTHPSGVTFNDKGFPDFSPYAKAQVDIKGLTGNYAKDSAMTNKAVGLKSTPDGFVWHHVENVKTMQLIPKEIHNAARHTGGTATLRNQ